MPRVRFTGHLRHYFPTLVEGATVAEVVADLERRYPGLAGYLTDEHGALRKRVNVFVNQELVHDRRRLSDPVPAEGEVFLVQALSGG